MNKLTKDIGERLTNLLDGFSFIASRSALVRTTDVGWQRIAIEVLPSATKGVGKLAAHAQVRVDSLEEIYTPLHPFLSAKDAKHHATLTTNCDLLLRDKALTNGFPTTDELGLSQFVHAYAAALRRDVIPWLDRYSSESEIYDGLIHQDPFGWITSDRLTRYPVLMALLAKQRDWQRFKAIAAEFDDYCNSRHALAYKPLADAMRGMHSPGNSTSVNKNA